MEFHWSSTRKISQQYLNSQSSYNSIDIFLIYGFCNFLSNTINTEISNLECTLFVNRRKQIQFFKICFVTIAHHHYIPLQQPDYQHWSTLFHRLTHVSLILLQFFLKKRNFFSIAHWHIDAICWKRNVSENANGSYEKTNNARMVKICVWQPWTFPYTMH